MEENNFQPHVVQQAKERVGSVLRQKWRIDRLLGMGGMAAVYAATHRTGNRVAIKMLHEMYTWDEDITRRFLREGYAANAVEHPGAVRILDDDVTEDGSVFIVMELLEGETFEARCERAGGKLPPAEVLALMDQLLDILAAAHAKRIVHRDIKPENIFITHEGRVKLLDFGIAKLRSHYPGSVATVTGRTVGTPRFMPPEQALGRDTIDAQTDIWAVGAVMFWAIAGRLVHLAESLTGQLVAQATQHAPPLASIVPEVPAAIAAIVDRALQFEQGQRWPDASAMQQAIREAHDALGLLRAPLPSLSPRADSSPRLPSSLDLERMAVGSSARSHPEEADTLAQAPPARRRAPMAIGIAAAAVAIAVYLLVRSGHDDAPPAAGPTDTGAPAQAQPIPAAEPAVAPEAPPPSTAAPASESPGGVSSGDPVPASSAAPDAPRKRPPPKASSTPPPAATPASDEDWLNRQH